VISSAVVVATLAGCSSSSGPAAASFSDPAKTYAAGCTATLTAAHTLEKPISGGGWFGDGTLHAPVGTTFLLTSDFNTFGGIAILGDGTPAEISADFTTGLVAGTDFSSTCAPATPPSTTHFVVLADTHVYATAALTGTACVFTAGTELHAYNYEAGLDSTTPPQLGGGDVQTKCGYQTGYTNDLVYADAVNR
jgi:hypothetical protein